MLRDDFDQVFGAGLDADAAGRALGRVDMSNAIGHVDGVVRAGYSAIPVAHAAIGAGIGSGKQILGGITAHGAAIFITLFRMVDRSLTMDVGDFRDKGRGCYTQVTG